MSVFEDLRDAFKQAVVNFRTELERDRIPETVDELLREMRVEVVEAQAQLDALHRDIRRTLERAGEEEGEADTCRRREAMAREIGDEDTERVAREYAEKHERRQRVLEGKALAMQEELDLRRGEVREMLEKLRDAERRKDDLGAGTSRRDARDSLRDADDLFSELDRMADRIEDADRRARAVEEEGDGGPRL